MLDKKDFEQIKQKLETVEQARDDLIKKSRDIVRLSKKIICAAHRNDLDEAAKHIKEIHLMIKDVDARAKKTPKLLCLGSYKVAIQEYVEAIAFYEIIKNKKIPTNDRLKLDEEYYLMGLIDLVGELTRKAINSAIKEEYKTAQQIQQLVSDLYSELMQFEFTGELRKKFDSIKYDLKKLEDLILSLKLNGKI